MIVSFHTPWRDLLYQNVLPTRRFHMHTVVDEFQRQDKEDHETPASHGIRETRKQGKSVVNKKVWWELNTSGNYP